MFTQIISFVNKLYKNLYTSYSFVYNYMAEYSPSPIKGDTRRFVVISKRDPRTGKVTVTAEGKRRKAAATKEQAKTKEVKADNYMAEYSPSPIKGDTRRFVVISKRDPRTGKVTVTAEGKRRKAATTKRIAAEEIGVKPKDIIGFNVQGKPIVKSGVDTTGAKLLKPLQSGAKASEIIQRSRAISKLKILREPVSELEAQGFVSSFQGPGTAKVERGLFGRIDPLAGTEVTITPIRKGTPKINDTIFSKAREFSEVVFPTTKVKPGEFDFELARSAGELEDLFKLGATKLESQLPERKIVKGESGLRTFFREVPRAAPPVLRFTGALIGESGRRPEIPILTAAGGVVLGAAGVGIAAIGTKSAVAVKLAGAGFGGAFLGSSVAEIQAAPGSEKFNIAARKVLATAGFYGGAKVGTRAIKSTITSIALKKAFVSGEGARTAELIEPGKGSV